MNKGAFWGVIIAIIIILVVLYFAIGKRKAEAPSTISGQEPAGATTEVASPKGGTTPTTLPDGLVITDTVIGTGEFAALPNDIVFVQYTGRLENGTKFDSSYDHGGEPFGFTIGEGRVIKGWDEGLIGARAGGKRHLVIPAALAYGAQSPSPLIPPNSNLVFDIEVVRVMQALQNQHK